jgi:very-short-patch-repair endonuclease
MMNKRMHRGALKPLYQLARENRSNETHAERILWGYLKTKPFGFKFRRQHPYSIYILDFYCHSLKLVVEVDGSIHHTEATRIKDEERQNFLKNDGMDILRFSNEVIVKEQEHVLENIDSYLRAKKQLDEREA